MIIRKTERREMGGARDCRTEQNSRIVTVVM